MAFGGTVEFELGGTVPGFGSGRHDQINDLGTLELVSIPVLSVLSFEGYVPAPGDEFEVMTWGVGLIGQFGSLIVSPTFTANGITFETIINNPSGSGNMVLRATAIPEARTILIWALLTGVTATAPLLGRRSRGATQSRGVQIDIADVKARRLT
jgi:hypothetical protein